jgi:ADP-heptose:LPS heptosyltransferase
LRPRHSVENQWDLLGALGIPPPPPVDDSLEMTEDPAARASVDARLARAGLGPDTRLIVMHVSAGNPFRRWSAASFAAVAAGLVASDAARAVVLTSGPSESEAAEAVGHTARLLAGPAGERILGIGEFDLAELRALIGGASLYIGGDSGPLHIAGTTTTPVVGLFGPTLAVRSLPWRDPAVPALGIEPGPLSCRPCDQRTCVPGDFRCLTQTPPERVIQAAERALAHGTRREVR